ncbi:hypothetical protein K7432_012301 [Basidiobolus ranarum]|uniref:BAG domain-containing protein n=1 Tax=Basidiobolus ranarum TaxID=34480 RepID=A0ABR2VT11_9FUNG
MTTFLPFHTFGSPYMSFPRYPIQRRQSLYNDPRVYYRRAQPEQYYVPERRVAHPTSYPLQYLTSSPDTYYTQPARYSPSERDYDQLPDLEQDDFVHPFAPRRMNSKYLQPQNLPVNSNRACHAKKPLSDDALKLKMGEEEVHRPQASNISQMSSRMEQEKKQRASLAENRKLLLQKRNEAARTIQHHWRLHHQKQLNAASRKISNFISSRIKIREAREILNCLRKLRAYEAEVDTIHERQSGRVFKHSLVFATSSEDPAKVLPVKENQNYLGYEDALLKMLIRIDEVDSMGSDIVRSTRKMLVKKTQSLLDQLDDYKSEQYEKFLHSHYSQ